ncbi:hypothetical protein Acr_05g0006180 [Actinidia rufa]|uniref:Uncharacterized protein n=1 Tax=Actinidia rufa TaxID=165716 RepID=A0A7J0ELY2_9ERIC|nr:hypothetical protein Acr_05g0006180 [Actinidia rufa]
MMHNSCRNFLYTGEWLYKSRPAVYSSMKWKLLSDGPRREIPGWMARRIHSICPKFPRMKVNVSEALISTFRSLELPKTDDVWSIAQEKSKEGDTLIEHVIAKEIIEKKLKALEYALQARNWYWTGDCGEYILSFVANYLADN